MSEGLKRFKYYLLSRHERRYLSLSLSLSLSLPLVSRDSFVHVYFDSNECR